MRKVVPYAHNGKKLDFSIENKYEKFRYKYSLIFCSLKVIYWNFLILYDDAHDAYNTK